MSEHRTALALFALALATATLERVSTQRVSDNAPPGTIGLAKLHQPIDRAPGEPLSQSR